MLQQLTTDLANGLMANDSFCNVTSPLAAATETETVISTALPYGLTAVQRSSAQWSFIIRWSMNLTMSLCSVLGNGVTLAAIRMKPSMWTKTNRILVSLSVAGIVLSVNSVGMFSYYFVAFIIGRPCNYAVVDTVIQGIRRIPPKVCINHLIVIGVDRYVAIVHPYFYEDKFSDRVVNWMLFTTWTVGFLLGVVFSMWAADAGRITCTIFPNIVPSTFTLVFDGGYYALTSIFLIVVYTKILRIALSHHKKIASESSAPSASATGNQLELTQQSAQSKQRARQFKAVFLTATIVGLFVVLWFPYAMSCLLVVLGKTTVSGSLNDISTGLGQFNFTFNWIVYGAVSKSFQRAYKDLFNKWCCCCEP